MCQSKKDGARRCGAHANATLAMEMQISRITNAPLGKVKQILSRLRKHGKNEEAPTTDELQEFTNRQKFLVQNDPSLSAHDRKILSNRWDRAAKEEINGGTWYAIKNGFLAVMSFLRKKVVAGGLIGVMSFTAITACSTGTPSVPAPSQSTTVTTVDPSPSPSNTNQDKVNAGFDAGNIFLGAKESDGTYEYNTLIAGDQGALLKGVKIPQDMKERYSDEEITAAQQIAATVAIEEIADSPILNVSDEKKIDAWYESFASSPFVSEKLSEGVRTQAKGYKTGEGVTVPSNYGSWRGTPDPERPTSNGSQYEDMTIQLKDTYLNAKGTPTFLYEMTTKRPVVNPDETDANKYDEYQQMTYVTTLGKEDGEFKLFGMQYTGSYRTVVQGEKPDWTE